MKSDPNAMSVKINCVTVEWVWVHQNIFIVAYKGTSESELFLEIADDKA